MNQNWIIFSDCHIPFHNKSLHQNLYKLIKQTKPYGVAILGDFIDLISLSRFAEGSLALLNGITLQGEYDQANVELNHIDSITAKRTKKVFIMGNHEEGRWTSYINRADHAKFKGTLPAPVEGMRLRERGYTVVDDWKSGYYTLGNDLELMHGFSTAITAAKVHMDRLGCSVIAGHSHTIQQWSTEKHSSYLIGGTFDAESEGFLWAPRAVRKRWCNGFAYVIINDNGDYHVNLIQAKGNKFIWGEHLVNGDFANKQ